MGTRKSPNSVDVGLVISDLNSGGAQRVLVTLANHWASKGYKTAVITYNDRSPDFYPLHPCVNRISLKREISSRAGAGRVMTVVRRISALRRILKNVRPGVIVSFITQTNILVILAALGLERRVIISERNDPERQSFGILWDTLRKVLYRCADVVTANTHGALETMRSYVPEKKLLFVPNPLYLQNSEKRTDQVSKNILTVGRLVRQKAHDVLIEAFATVAKNFSDWRLKIVGEGSLRGELEGQADKLGISDHIDWYRNTRNIDTFYKSSEIFVLPSRYEGLPNALLEAMSFGLPVIVTDGSPGPLELIEDEKTGLVVPVNDAMSLAKAIEKLIRHPVLRASLGQAAMLRVADYSPEKAIGAWEEVLTVGSKRSRFGG